MSSSLTLNTCNSDRGHKFSQHVGMRDGQRMFSHLFLQTGISDIPLTPRGEDQIKSKAKFIIGKGSKKPLSVQLDRFDWNMITEIIDPDDLEVAYISPRIRSRKTFELMCGHLQELPNHIITEEAREWDYG